MNYKIALQTKPVVVCLLLLYFLFPFNLKAQYQRSLDSLYQLKTPIERVRGFLGSAEELKLTRDEYIQYMNATEKLGIEKKDKLLLGHIASIKRQWSACDGLEYSKTVKAQQQLAEQYRKEKQMLYLGYLYHSMAQQHFVHQEYGLAFESYFQAYDIFENIGFENVPAISKFLHDFALSRYYFKDYNEVIRLMQISLKHVPYNTNHDIQRHNNLGISYSNLGVKDSAFYYFEKTIELGKKYNSLAWEGITAGNIGDIYYREQNYEEALIYYKQGYEALKNCPFDPIRIGSYVNVAKTYFRLDSINETKRFLGFIEKDLNNLRKNKSYGDDQQIETSKKDYYQIKSEYLIQTKMFQDALKYKDSLSYSQNILDSKYNSAIVKMSSDKLVIQNKELLLAQKEKEKTNQRLFYTGLILIVFIIGGLGYFYMYKSKQKKKRQSERLIAENRISILEKRQVQKDLEIAQKEINHFVSKINEQNKIVSKIEEDLKKLKGLELEERKHIGETLDKLKNTKILTDEDWKAFQDNFDKVFPDFRTLIKNEAPAITASEMRYLMLLKLNFSHKEMASALGVSDATIRVTWNRVRKKLNGSSEDTPTTLIERIIQTEQTLKVS